MCVWRMRRGISIAVTRTDRRRLRALARGRNAPQKHVWRAEIVLLTAEGLGTNEIMRRAGTSQADAYKLFKLTEEIDDGYCNSEANVF
jgi:hypothetical protein